MKFKQYITEGVEGKYDLKKLYNMYNSKLFNNELIKPSKFQKFGWNNRKDIVGTVAVIPEYDNIPKGILAKYSPTTGKVKKWNKFQISKRFDLTEEDVHSIIVHEMIHVKHMMDGILKTSGGDTMHGTEFVQIRRDLQKKVPFKIIKTEIDFKPSEFIEAKPLGFILWYDKGKYRVVKASSQWIKDKQMLLHDKFLTLSKYYPNTFWMIGISKSRELVNLKGIRKVEFKSWQVIKQEQWEEIELGIVEVLRTIGEMKK